MEIPEVDGPFSITGDKISSFLFVAFTQFLCAYIAFVGSSRNQTNKAVCSEAPSYQRFFPHDERYAVYDGDLSDGHALDRPCRQVFLSFEIGVVALKVKLETL